MRTVTCVHQQLAHVLDQADGLTHGRLGLGHGVALHVQSALLGLNARDARHGALGLCGGYRVVAGAQHALACGQFFVQIDQRILASANVADRVVVHIGRGHAID